MNEHTIYFKVTVESNSDYERLSQYAQELTDSIVKDEIVNFDDVKAISAVIEDIEADESNSDDFDYDDDDDDD